jgi:adenine-specific DNA-methyltransferase
MDIEHLGQVFTPQQVVLDMLQLRKNFGSILEPCVGSGSFWQHINNHSAVGIEIDQAYCPPDCLNIDFFDYDIKNKFDTIITNPPYVAGKNISPSTRSKLNRSFKFKTNLYIHFIAKCLEHLNPGGELIFITPRDFIKHTLATRINDFMFIRGNITHWYEYGDNNMFSGPTAHNLVIWRFEKDYIGPKMTIVNGVSKNLMNVNGQLMFTSGKYDRRFSELFFVKVGAVSGADSIFVNENGNLDIVYSGTLVNGQTRKVYYDHYDDYLSSYKERLKSRKIKNFDDNNWFKWGRMLYNDNSDRIYVNCKTRRDTPFFIHQCKNFDGSVLGLFPKKEIDLEKACTALNDIDWNDLGFKYGGRLMFSQRSLTNALLPEGFMK